MSQPDKMEPGYTLLWVGNRAPGARSYTMLLDHVGDVVWYQELDAGDIRQLPNGNLFYQFQGGAAEATLLGEIVRSWHPAGTTETPLPDSIEVDSPDDHPIFFHHEVFPTEHGTILTLDRVDRLVQGYPTSDTDPDAPTADTVVIDEPIVEFDMETGEILHYYSLVDMLDPRRIGFNSVAPQPPCPARNPECKADWVHDNAIIYDSSDDTYIVSLRHQDAVIKVRRATGELVWILGNHWGWSPEFEPYLLTPVGTPFVWQYHQHAPMLTPEGTLLLFDNGNNRAMPFEIDPDTGEPVEPIADADNFSRAVEYLIDPATMTVRQIWESKGNAGVDLYSRFISDADWLPETGNVLITFGGISFVDHVATNGNAVRIIEVDRNTPATTLFDLSIQATDPESPGYTVYRSERIADLYSHLTVALVADTPSPAQLGTVGTVRFTATATGGSGSYDYQFWVRDPSGNWAVVQLYGNGNTFDWAPPSAGNWVVAVGAKNLGSPAVSEADTARSFKVVNGPPPPPAPVLEVSFDGGADGFTYIDDAFRTTNQPTYASGSHVPDQGFSGGGLRVLLGGVDNADIQHMSGGWRRTFTLATSGEVNLTFRYKLTQMPEYEIDELSQVLVRVDETLVGATPNDYVAQVVGDGEGGPSLTTGWVQVVSHLGTLGAGEHTLTIGGYNNKKTFNDETTEVMIDDIVVQPTSAPLPPAPILEVSFDGGADGFTYIDDAFRTTNQPTYASGSHVPDQGFSGGWLRVLLGGVDNADIQHMSGGWRRTFTLATSSEVNLTFRYKLTQMPEYEIDELSQVLVRVDETLVGATPNDYVAQVVGDGEGGPSLTTGWVQVVFHLGTLGAGEHTLTIGGYNNKKTFNNEITEVLIEDVVIQPTSAPPSPAPILEVSFDGGADGFTYIDDAFRTTNQPTYASGSHVPDQGFSGGGLRVLLGGVDNADIQHMSGGWRRTFTLATSSEVNLTFRYKLTQMPEYEIDELSQVLVRVDETLVGATPNDYVAQVVGDGQGGPSLTTGWVQVVFHLGTLGAGEHTLTIGGYNNKKTFNDETTEVLIDDIVVQPTSAPLPPAPILEVSFDGGADGFTYIDDAFRTTNQPTYASGSHVPDQGFSGGGLRVLLGGVDNADIQHMSGGWRRTFTLATSGEVNLTFRYKLTQMPEYEIDELSQVLVRVDETLVGATPNDYVAQVVGDGEGGPSLTTGWVQVVSHLGTLGAGEHTLTIGGYNNKKTFNDETTEVLIDDVTLE